MCAEPTSLAVLMAKADKYATADSAMRIKVTASDKVVPTPATPKPAGDNRGGQNNYKRKADQMDPRSNSKLVANVEGEASTPQAGPPRKRPNRSNPKWLPRQSLEQLHDAPCKIHSGAMPSPEYRASFATARRRPRQVAASPAAMTCSTLHRPPPQHWPCGLLLRRARLPPAGSGPVRFRGRAASPASPVAGELLPPLHPVRDREEATNRRSAAASRVGPAR
ncbi:hypothetical protein D1007_35005 [Hordeum vulgare]|nr:hypothetical protein D1007_35005 [Hordeum vulgare]